MRPTSGLGADPGVAEAIAAWLDTATADSSGDAKPAPATIAAYRRDVEGIVGRIAGVGDAGRLHLRDLSKQALRSAFSSWAGDHAATSVLRAHSAWSRFFDFLVAQDIVEGNPMAAVAKPKVAQCGPRPIGDPDAAARLLAVAAVADRAARRPWPERDLAMIATFCVTGIRVGEAVRLNMASLDGPVGDRRLVVVGNGGRTRTIPLHDALEAALRAYSDSRAARFPNADLKVATAALFVDTRGRRLSADQVKYLTERLYQRAGIRSEVPPGALVDALRHTFAISALAAGADVVQLQLLLGHASLETTRRYVQTAAQSLREMTNGHPAQVALRAQLGLDSPLDTPARPARPRRPRAS